MELVISVRVAASCPTCTVSSFLSYSVDTWHCVK